MGKIGTNPWRLGGWIVAVLLLHGAAGNTLAAEPVEAKTAPGFNLPRIHEAWREFRWGVTRAGTPLVAWEEPALTHDPSGPEIRVLLVGGLDRKTDSTRAVQTACESWGKVSRPSASGATAAPPDADADSIAATYRGWRLAAIPAVFPAAAPANSSPATPSLDNSSLVNLPPLTFPPAGPAYQHTTLVEAQYLWRYLGQRAPDLVLDVRAGDKLKIVEPRELAPTELAAALGRAAAGGVGTITALQVQVPGPDHPEHRDWLATTLRVARRLQLNKPSAARRELQRRQQRSPLEVARQLATVYGHDLPRLEYIPTTALIGRIQLDQLTGERQAMADAERLLQPYLAGEQPTTPQSGSGQAGHLLFHLLATAGTPAARPQYQQLVEVAANQMFEPNGKRRELMPFHNEMSDALYMGGPILAAAGQLAAARGDQPAADRYYDACVAHLRAMRQLVLRPDGLYRHSPLDETAWGRGNGFPALGLTLCIDLFPAGDERRAALVTMAQQHFTALLGHQDADGMWHQVIDRAESFRELSSTCMIGWSLAHARRQGWLEGECYEQAADLAWHAARLRMATDGQLLDVCTGTGKQPNLRAYYDREALLGKDPRGGAFALLLAVERVQSKR
ncbi:MAG: glycoside hydrolase family 88 protein [Planctomycetota bacterium]